MRKNDNDIAIHLRNLRGTNRLPPSDSHHK